MLKNEYHLMTAFQLILDLFFLEPTGHYLVQVHWELLCSVMCGDTSTENRKKLFYIECWMMFVSIIFLALVGAELPDL